MCDCPGFVYNPQFVQYTSNIRGLLVRLLCIVEIQGLCLKIRGWCNSALVHNIYMYTILSVQTSSDSKSDVYYNYVNSMIIIYVRDGFKTGSPF